jgi:phosphoglycolate phosphatase
MVPTQLQAAIIDLDGTMVDTLGDFTVALNATLAELGLPALRADAIGAMVGKGSEHLIRSALRASGGAPDLYERAWADYQCHYEAVNGLHSRVYDGVEPGLQALQRAGLPLACVTNKPTRFAQDLLGRKRLAPYFSHVYGGDAFERRKPDPMPLLQACKALRSDPGRTLLVGDSSNDAAAARAAGCPVVLVTYGYNHGEPVRNVEADGFVDSLAQLGRWLG